MAPLRVKKIILENLFSDQHIVAIILKETFTLNQFYYKPRKETGPGDEPSVGMRLVR